ncbi:MAG: sensor histidine kinase, partial [Chloroflexi bacterium]|nr:sensor histidine kinase [Chloroflexota bacterium]
RRFLDIGDPATARSELSELERAAKEVYADTREAILGLRSTISPREGLTAALQEYLDKFQQLSGIPVTLTIVPEHASVRLSAEVEIQVIRIIQEALANVRKHSGASQAWLKLEIVGDKALAMVCDNGNGFAVQQPSVGKWPRFGLRMMQERAESIGGELVVESQPGNGTKVLVTVPGQRQG